MTEKITIKETIVVEGKDDRSAVLSSVNANVICTSGWGLNDEIIEKIRGAYEISGIIILTDPDHAGRKIRERLTELFPDAKQAFLTQAEAEKKGDIGIENARPEDIVKALEAASAQVGDASPGEISREDLVMLGLAGSSQSAEKRARVGALLGIGYANANAFQKRLNYMKISRQKLASACEEASD